MSRRFCPQCGSLETKDNPLLEILCQRCYTKEKSLLQTYKQPRIVICSTCNSYLYRGKWHKAYSNNIEKNLSLVVENLFKEKIAPNQEAEIKELYIITKPRKDFPRKTGNKAHLEAEILVKGKIHQNATTTKESYNIPLNIQFSQCKNCSRRSSNYYEAILQIRPSSKKIIQFVMSKIKHRGDVFISKTVNLKEGTDLYISSQKFTSQLISQLKRKCNAETKMSKKLYGQKKGRRLYRTTFLFRLIE